MHSFSAKCCLSYIHETLCFVELQDWGCGAASIELQDVGCGAASIELQDWGCGSATMVIYIYLRGKRKFDIVMFLELLCIFSLCFSAFSHLLFPEPYNTISTIKISPYECTLCAVTQKDNKPIRGVFKNMLPFMCRVISVYGQFRTKIFLIAK
jgi:hypothetical protein